jgi:hypothetical protein
MTERQIIIEWLVARPDDEAHPEFSRLAMADLGTKEYTDVVFKHDITIHEDFHIVFRQGPEMLRKYYESLSPESLVECFDGWCCHRYR